MPSVSELTALYENLLLAPSRGPAVCEICFNLTNGYRRCYACAHGEQWLDAFAPISYSVGCEQLNHALRDYKRLDGEVARRLRMELAAVLWRFLEQHEGCIARAAGAERFELVTTVPSSDRRNDEHHPLRGIVGTLCGPTRDRHEQLLKRSTVPAAAHEFHAQKYESSRRLAGASVLLIDDTWTTGANGQGAAAALKRAGAARVAAVVFGRYLNREWHQNDRRLRGLVRPFDWRHCVLCPSRRPSREYDNPVACARDDTPPGIQASRCRS